MLVTDVVFGGGGAGVVCQRRLWYRDMYGRNYVSRHTSRKMLEKYQQPPRIAV